jgi:hypothetical protein
MKPQEFLAYAQRIASSSTLGAAEYRSAVSRAYYGAYLQIRDWLKSLGIVIRGGNEHKLIRVYLAESKVAIAVDLADLLGNLQTSRKDADYKLELAAIETHKASQWAVQRAEQIQLVLQQCIPVANEIVAGISGYRRKTKSVTRGFAETHVQTSVVLTSIVCTAKIPPSILDAVLTDARP